MPIFAVQLCRDQKRQEGRSAANVSSNGQEFFCSARVLIRQSFETSAHTMKMLNFFENWFVRHSSAPFLSG